MEPILAEREGKEPIRPWFGANFGRLTLYLLVVSFTSAVLLGLLDSNSDNETALEAILPWTGIIFFYGGLFALPGTLVWLLVVSRLRPGSPITSRRSTAAWSAPPTIGLVWIIFWWTYGEFPLLLIYGILLPAGSAWVIRFRELSKEDEKPVNAFGFE